MKDNSSASSGKAARLSVHAKPSNSAADSAFEAGTLGLVPSCLQLERILVPVDFSEGSEKALSYAKKFAEQFGSKITLLHVIQPMVYPADFGYPPTVIDTIDESVQREVEERLAALAKQTSPEAQPLVRLGQPFHEISEAARQLDIDLIIINTHGRTGLKHALLGSTAERVVRHAPCPVLTVRERERDFV